MKTAFHPVYSRWANGSERVFYLPEDGFELKEVSDTDEIVPLCGNGYVLVVLRNDVCCGWVGAETLGYKSASDWIKATGWKPPPRPAD